MKKFISLTVMVVSLLVTSTECFGKHNLSRIPTDENQIVIRVSEGGWGDAPVRDIEAVLYWTADELLEYFPDKHLPPIIVRHDDRDGPITLYRRGPDNEFIVHLDVEGPNWAQLVYQFSHELTHAMARREGGKAKRHPNIWFEEVLCVTASLFTLRRMGVSVRSLPPDPKREGDNQSFRRYADYQMSKPGRQLPPGMTLAKWYKENAGGLRNEGVRSAGARNKQYVVARQMLPIFERSPDSWGAIASLNVGEPDGSQSFENYLNKWHANSADKHKAVIREIINMFRE